MQMSLLVMMCSKGPMDIPTKPNYSKEKQDYLSHILLTFFSEEFLKIQKNPFTKPHILPMIMISRIGESKAISSFHRKCKELSLCVRRLLLKKILEELKIFLEPGNQVPTHFAALAYGY